MFVGTTNKQDKNKIVLVETYYMDRLDPQILSNDCFSIIIIKSGSLTAKINDVPCQIAGPVAVCLDELKKIVISSNLTAEVRIIKFNPQFLNVNMFISTVRNSQYDHLCQQHAFFQLSPFLTDDINKMFIYLNEDTLGKIVDAFNNLTRNLEEQKDWYWPCRARSYFIDIINIFERIFHNYYIETSYDPSISVRVSSEFKNLLAYVHNHLDEKITLDSLYLKFRINKNQIENIFKYYLHLSFYEYLQQARLQQAKYYLSFTELDGEHIASRIGLSSSQNFCKFFKKMSGTTPKKFRSETVMRRKADPELIELQLSQQR